MPKMSDLDLKAVCAAKIQNALGYLGGRLTQERMRAERYYKGEKFGNETDGRSQVVSHDVAEAVDAMLPALMKIFSSGDEVVRFEPTGPGDEKAASQATDYINWIWNQQNDGFAVFHAWFKDALLKMMGAMKRFWDRVNGTVVSAGSANAQTLSYAIAPTALVNGETYSFRAGFANTSACTLQINALAAKTIKKRIAGVGQADLAANDIIVGQRVVVVYDATSDALEMVSPVANVATGSVTSVASGAGLAGGPITGSGTLSAVETVNAQSGTSYTVAAGDQAKLVTFSNAAAIAVTLPQATGSFGAGWFADFVCLPTSTGAATITPTTSTIDGKASLVLSPGRGARVVSDGTNYALMKQTGVGDVAIVQDRKSASSAGASITANTFTDRDLNTKGLLINKRIDFWVVAGRGFPGCLGAYRIAW
jgi:hypothetical protein